MWQQQAHGSRSSQQPGSPLSGNQPHTAGGRNRRSRPPKLALVENPDILATISKLKTKRPQLVIGFAAETEKVIEHAKAKLKRKGCDWIVANDVSTEGGAMGGDDNAIHLITASGVDSWPTQSKDEVAKMLVACIAPALEDKDKA